MKAPLSFLTNTDTGVVTNLFSQDLNLIDTELPDATLNTLFCVSFLFAVFCSTGDYSYKLHADISMPRASGCDAYIVTVFGYQLSHSRGTSLRRAKVLLENLPPVETARFGGEESIIVRPSCSCCY